jgi:hypothetical protein
MSVDIPRYFVVWQCKSRSRGQLWTSFKDLARQRAMEYRAKPWVIEGSVSIQIRDKHNMVTGTLEPTTKEERDG